MILYLGDDTIHGAAAYLCGVMQYHNIPFERVDTGTAPQKVTGYDAYILSDYPAANFKPGQMEELCHAVASGSGLAMFGGWESFYGLLGEYHHSPLAEVLPILMQNADDRRNFAQPVMVQHCQEHPILEGLPWNMPPFIGGFNQFIKKPGAETVLEAVRFEVRLDERPAGTASFTPLERFPLLVVGKYGKGNVAALATDVAPHWVGGWVDWGERRIKQQTIGDGFIEVGADYATFFAQLVKWCAAAFNPASNF
jgi:uncharacterized membrane protein